MSLDLFGDAMSLLCTPTLLAYLLAGVVLGFIIGAIPGFNDTNILAIVLPFSVYFGL